MSKKISKSCSLANALAATLSLSGGIVLLSTSAHANTDTWTGGGSSNAWGNGNNWSGGAAPASGDDVIFAGSASITQLVSLLDAAYSLDSLTFNTGTSASSFTVTAGGANNALSIGAGGITNNTSLTQTIDAPVTLTASSTFNAATAGGTLSFLGTSSNSHNAVSMGSNALTVTGAGNVTIASPLTSTGSGGTLTKTGTGTLTLTGVGNSIAGATYFDSGTTLIQGADNDSYASLSTTAAAYISYNSGDIGTVTVSGTSSGGTDSTWKFNNNFLYVGYSGTGALSITGGGLVSGWYGMIGYNSGSNGTVTVSGTSSVGTASTWNVMQSFYVGYNGAGTLNITGGGQVPVSGNGYIGFNSGSKGTVTVSGTSSSGTASTWNLFSEYLYVGNYGTGTLNITDGGLVSCGTGIIGDGYNNSSSGTVTVSGTSSSGTASKWNLNNHYLYVGNGSAGTLNITGGGLVSSGEGLIGGDNYSCIATVSGTSSSGTASTWNLNGYNLLVGGDGVPGTLNITDGGKVTTGSGTTSLSISSGESSILNVNGGSLTTNILSIGSGNAPAISLTNPTLANGGGYALNLGNNNGSSTIAVAITDAAGGAGGIDKTGTGTLTMTGASTYSGGTQIDGGKVIATGGTISGMTLTSGPLGIGNVIVSSGATLAVGQAANSSSTALAGYKTLDINSLTLTGGSATPLLTFNLGATGSLNGSTNDFLRIAGSANSLVFSGSGDFDLGFASGSGSTITGTQTYELMSFATPISVNSATVSNPNSELTAVGTGNLGSIPNGTFSWDISDGNIVGLEFSYNGTSSMPEPPSSLLALAASVPAILFAAFWRRSK